MLRASRARHCRGPFTSAAGVTSGARSARALPTGSREPPCPQRGGVDGIWDADDAGHGVMPAFHLHERFLRRHGQGVSVLKRKGLDAFAFGKGTTGFGEEVASFEDVLDDMI